MNDRLHITNHAEVRANQRGIRLKDIPLILLFGTEASDGRICITKKDIQDTQNSQLKIGKRLTQLEGKCVVADGETIITTYHANKKQRQRMFRQ
jgi:hypothetical protein